MICTNCNKNLVAGTYPKWLCLQVECSEYLVLKTIREVGHAKRLNMWREGRMTIY